MTDDLPSHIDDAMRLAAAHLGKGTRRGLYPGVGERRSGKLGFALALPDGTVHSAGDADEPFSIQSVSKVFYPRARAPPRRQFAVGQRGARAIRQRIQLDRPARKRAGHPAQPADQRGRDYHHRSADRRAQRRCGRRRNRRVHACPCGRRPRPNRFRRCIVRGRNRRAATASLAHFMDAFGNLTHPVETVVASASISANAQSR